MRWEFLESFCCFREHFGAFIVFARWFSCVPKSSMQHKIFRGNSSIFNFCYKIPVSFLSPSGQWGFIPSSILIRSLAVFYRTLAFFCGSLAILCCFASQIKYGTTQDCWESLHKFRSLDHFGSSSLVIPWPRRAFFSVRESIRSTSQIESNSDFGCTRISWLGPRMTRNGHKSHKPLPLKMHPTPIHYCGTCC